MTAAAIGMIIRSFFFILFCRLPVSLLYLLLLLGDILFDIQKQQKYRKDYAGYRLKSYESKCYRALDARRLHGDELARRIEIGRDIAGFRENKIEYAVQIRRCDGDCSMLDIAMPSHLKPFFHSTWSSTSANRAMNTYEHGRPPIFL